MGEEIRTERLVLRPARGDDAEWIVPHCAEPRIYRMLQRMKPRQSLEESRAFLVSLEQDTRAHVFTVWEEGVFCGLCGIERNASGLDELGYWFAVSAWGRGIAHESAEAVIGFGRREKRLKALVSGHFADNPASGRVLARLGFLPAGWGLRHSLGRGEWVRHRAMGLIFKENGPHP